MTGFEAIVELFIASHYVYNISTTGKVTAVEMVLAKK